MPCKWLPRLGTLLVGGPQFTFAHLRQLARLSTLKRYLTPAGAIWVIHTKGKGAAFKDVEGFAAAKQAGLVDVKVASFSGAIPHSAPSPSPP